MGLTTALLALSITCAAFVTTSTAFNCSSAGTTCNALIDYVPPNKTTLSDIKSLFGVKKLGSLLGANGFPRSTSPNESVAAQHTVRIPFHCLCSNGSGSANNRPLYKVVAGDNLDHIAKEIFAGLVTFQEIAAANNLPDPNLIEIGQELKIPLPCSCDQVDGAKVVHYGHVVEAGSTVEEIAQTYNASSETLLRLNGLASSNDLKAGAVLDVPLGACSSMVGNNSLDYPLLVANGTYVFTATNCVLCKCDAENNWILQCEASQVNSSLWSTCPSLQCPGPLYVGDTTTSNCNRSSCVYTGYTNQTILTDLVSESTCPASGGYSPKIGFQGFWSWNLLLIVIHLLLLYCHLRP